MKKYLNLLSMRGKLSILVPMVLLSVIFLASALSAQSEEVSNPKNYSALGIVSSISDSQMRLDLANGDSRDFDISNVKRIESKDYTPLGILDIYVGDKLIIQGIEDRSTIDLNRIIDMTWDNTRPTTTPAILDQVSTSTATSTDDIASSTEATTGPVSSGIDQGITENATTTIDFATSTDNDVPTSTSENSTVTPDVSTTTSDASTATNENTNSNPTDTSTDSSIINQSVDLSGSVSENNVNDGSSGTLTTP